MKGVHEGGIRALSWSNQQNGYFYTGGGSTDCILKAWNLNQKSEIWQRNTNS